MSGAFDYIESINNHNKKTLGSDYNAFLTTKFFSYFIDTIHYANEANRFRPLGNEDMHYTYLFNTVKKKKRFTKWYKTEKDVDIETISTYYDCSLAKAKEYKELLSVEQINKISEWINNKGE